MAFLNIPQNVALQDLERQLAANREQQNVLMLAILALRRRQREEAERQRAPRRRRRWWVKPWVRDREMHSQYHHLFQQLDEELDMDYKSYVRMDRNTFREILERVGPRLRKNPRLVQMLLE